VILHPVVLGVEAANMNVQLPACPHGDVGKDPHFAQCSFLVVTRPGGANHSHLNLFRKPGFLSGTALEITSEEDAIVAPTCYDAFVEELCNKQLKKEHCGSMLLAALADATSTHDLACMVRFLPTGEL